MKAPSNGFLANSGEGNSYPQFVFNICFLISFLSHFYHFLNFKSRIKNLFCTHLNGIFGILFFLGSSNVASWSCPSLTPSFLWTKWANKVRFSPIFCWSEWKMQHDFILTSVISFYVETILNIILQLATLLETLAIIELTLHADLLYNVQEHGWWEILKLCYASHLLKICLFIPFVWWNKFDFPSWVNQFIMVLEIGSAFWTRNILFIIEEQKLFGDTVCQSPWGRENKTRTRDFIFLNGMF